MRVFYSFMLLSCFFTCACSKNDSNQEATPTQIFINAFVDEIRGAPSQSAMEKSEKFSAHGIRFDYPSPLRLNKSDDDGSKTYELEYGQFTAELYIPGYELTAADYMNQLHGIYKTSIGKDAKIESGRKYTLCGVQGTSTVITLTLMGDPHRYEAFDLPLINGEPRILIFDGETDSKRELDSFGKSSVKRIMDSLRCN